MSVTTSPWSRGKPFVDHGEVYNMSQIAAGDSFASSGPTRLPNTLHVLSVENPRLDARSPIQSFLFLQIRRSTL